MTMSYDEAMTKARDDVRTLARGLALRLAAETASDYEGAGSWVAFDVALGRLILLAEAATEAQIWADLEGHREWVGEIMDRMEDDTPQSLADEAARWYDGCRAEAQKQLEAAIKNVEAGS